jgi:hypothetical protein
MAAIIRFLTVLTARTSLWQGMGLLSLHVGSHMFHSHTTLLFCCSAGGYGGGRGGGGYGGGGELLAVSSARVCAAELCTLYGGHV